jgi:voltage-dependent potassium channel beta subunit
MEYRRLGSAGLQVSEVALGAWLTFGESIDEGTARACVEAAVENGVNFFDNADVYARGEAERVMGKVIRDLGLRREDLVISSKVYWPMSDDVNDRGLSRKHVMQSIDGSLQRLGTDYVDIYYCHRFDEETPMEEIVRAMDDLVHQGKVLYWGTSVWSAAQIERATGVARRFNAYPPRVEQPRYNMIDRHVEPEILPTCAAHGIGVTVFSPLAQGLLTGKYNDGVPKGSRAETSEWIKHDLTEENLAKARKLAKVANKLGLEPARLALAWILRRPEISAVITGATRAEHVLSNVGASGVNLDEGTLEEIEGILDNAP